MVKFVVEERSNFSENRPRIKKGYYKGRFVELVHQKQENGQYVPIENEYGHLGIVKFAVVGDDGEIMKYKDGNTWYDVVLSYFINLKNKDKKTGELYNGFSTRSKATKLFECMGYKFDPANPTIDTDLFLGKEVELNIDDYQPKEGEKFSVIKEVKKWEEDAIEEKNDNANKVDNKKKESLDKMLASGLITKEAYDKAISQL